MDVVEGEAVVEIGSFIQMGAPTSPGSSHLEYARVKICIILVLVFSFIFPPLSHPHVFILVIHAGTVIIL